MMTQQQFLEGYARRGAVARLAEIEQEMAQLQAWLNGHASAPKDHTSNETALERCSSATREPTGESPLARLASQTRTVTARLMAQTPRIVFSPLTKSWFVVTRYREKQGVGRDGHRHSYLVASIKYNVTDQMTEILRSHRKRATTQLRLSRSKKVR